MNKQVLVIEDDTICRHFYLAALKKLHCQITLVGTAKETLEKVNEKIYDCILMDLGLPDCYGQTLLKEVKAHSLNSVTPIHIVSAHITDPIRQACLDLGAVGVYCKPIRAETIQGFVA